jgi:hypothetical protein
MFNDDDRKVFKAMHNDMMKDLDSMSVQKSESKSTSLFTTLFKLWLGWGVLTIVLGGTFFGLVFYVLYHFISKWW